MIGILFDIRSYMLTAWNLDNHGSICQILLKGLFAFISTYFAFLIICLYAQLQQFEKQRIIKDVQHLLVRILLLFFNGFCEISNIFTEPMLFLPAIAYIFRQFKRSNFLWHFPHQLFCPAYFIVVIFIGNSSSCLVSTIWSVIWLGVSSQYRLLCDFTWFLVKCFRSF